MERTAGVLDPYTMAFLVCEYRKTWNFFLRDSDARIVANRFNFPSREACLLAIESVMASDSAKVSDQGEEPAGCHHARPAGNVSFKISPLESGWRYELLTADGDIIAEGGTGTTKEACLHLITRVQASARAEVRVL